MNNRQFLKWYSFLTVIYVIIGSIGPAFATDVTNVWILIGSIIITAAAMFATAVIRASTMGKPWYWPLGIMVPGWNLYFLVELGK